MKMKNVIALILYALVMPCVVVAADISAEWESLNKQYAELITDSKYERALEVALKLNKIDPSDTNSRLYIVLACIKSGQEVPKWVLNEPWTNATPHDVVNKKLADVLINGT